MNSRQLSRRTFDAVAPGSRQAKALTAALESALLREVITAAETAARAAVARLNAAGHALAPDASEGPLAFRGPAGRGDGTLRLSLDILGTVSAELTPAPPRAHARASAPRDAEDQRFSRRVETARRKEQRGGYRALSADEQLAVCVAAFEAEVNNGGFSQFFWNSAGDRANATLRFLERIGATTAAGLLRDAMGIFPDGKPPASRTKRTQLLPELERRHRRRLERLDARFYESDENLAALAERTLESRRPRHE